MVVLFSSVATRIEVYDWSKGYLIDVTFNNFIAFNQPRSLDLTLGEIMNQNPIVVTDMDQLRVTLDHVFYYQSTNYNYGVHSVMQPWFGRGSTSRDVCERENFYHAP